MKYLLLIFCLLFNGSAQTQSLYSNVSKETGRPLINYYGPKDYKADPRNLAIVQDSKGIIYVGNNSGAVLEFDGVTWRHIILPNNLAVESLEKDKHGNIYVGGTKDFGFLKPDSNGNLCFKSLLKYVNKQDRIFTRIKVNVTREGVYFLSSRRLFLWKNNMLKTWRSQTDFRSSFYVNNNFYVDDEENGLMIMKNGILMQMPERRSFLQTN